jgi:DNA-binding transcriptional ArsR family regulator
VALRRMVPTNYFKDPDILSLSQREHRQILLGLILFADDEGRESAHTSLLSREMGDYTPDEIEVALADLVENNLIVLYQVGKHRYYSLTRWNRWQTINKKRMTPSRLPAPPLSEDQTTTSNVQEDSGETPASAVQVQEDSGELSAQFKLIESNLSEDEENENTNIVLFPADNAAVFSEEIASLATSIAPILHVLLTPALMRIVSDYKDTPGLRLLGEADAAREWIDDKQRNRRGQRMTPAFFRRWLKKEVEAMQHRQTQHTPIGGSAALSPSASSRDAPKPVGKGQNLMDLEAQYRAASLTAKGKQHG